MSPKEDCGRNGLCDGEGSCAYWGSDVQCGEPPSCEDGVRKSASHCNGMGECVVDEEVECTPVTACADDEPVCAETCEASDECAGDLVCIDEECVDPEEQRMEMDVGTEDASEDATGGGTGSGGGGESGCSTSRGSEPAPWWGLVFGLFLAARSRRGDGPQSNRTSSEEP